MNWLLMGLMTSALSYFGVISTMDYAEYKFDIPFRDQAKCTSKCYDWFEIYLKKNYDQDQVRDYSEGVFDSEFKLTLAQATRNKFEYIFDKLGLKEGDHVLDAGCGSGVWLEYLQSRGVSAVGLTLSEKQAEVIRNKNLDLEVHVMDYRVKNQGFLGKFDAITALGSSEHVCTSRGVFKNNIAAKRCNKTRIEVWNLFKQYLKEQGKIFITTLTVNDKVEWSKWDYLQAYILDRHYGGYYSSWSDIEKKVIPNTGLILSDVQDKTKDYHWSSVIDDDHFGHWTINWGEDTANKFYYLLKGSLTDLYFIHHWAYYYLDTWMWQFGGYQKRPLTDEQIAKAPMQLKYFMLEKN